MKKITQNIFLIGPMGSGKTTIGRHLAKMLMMDFYDCDQELEHLTGASVSLIFDIEGEARFRQRETELLKQLSEKTNALISTGGGVICSEENRGLLCSRGFVVYLKTSIEKQLKRLSQDKSRPLLQTEDRTQRLLDLAHSRNPLYDATADLVYITKDSSVFVSAKTLSAAILKQVDPLTPEQSNAKR
jgi:shikimate kinase